MHSNQTVSGTQQRRRVRGRLLSVTAVAIAAAATAASATAMPAAADPSASHTAALGVRVVGTLTVDPSHVGVVVAVPGAGGPLNAQAFRLWQNGQPMAVRVNPLPASALRIAVVVDAGPGAQLQGAQNAVADLMIGLPNGAEAAVVAARPARLVQPLTGDAGSVVQALAGATFSGPRDDASALTLAAREVLRGPRGDAPSSSSRPPRSRPRWRATCPGRFVLQMPACTSRPCRKSRRRSPGSLAPAEAGRLPRRPPARSCQPSMRSVPILPTSTNSPTPRLSRR